MSLKGKVALVTGSTSGIGLGVAEALAAEGASIMLNGFGDAAAIETLRASFEPRFGVRAGLVLPFRRVTDRASLPVNLAARDSLPLPVWSAKLDLTLPPA